MRIAPGKETQPPLGGCAWNVPKPSRGRSVSLPRSSPSRRWGAFADLLMHGWGFEKFAREEGHDPGVRPGFTSRYKRGRVLWGPRESSSGRGLGWRVLPGVPWVSLCKEGAVLRSWLLGGFDEYVFVYCSSSERPER